MPRGELYTEPEIILCTYIARFGRDTFDECDIHRWCLRSLGSIGTKVQNIAAMLSEEGYDYHPSVKPLSGLPRGQQGRRTNWDIVSKLVNLPECQHRANVRSA
jgi:hypothetical protein